jgi:hypothetical protein
MSKQHPYQSPPGCLTALAAYSTLDQKSAACGASVDSAAHDFYVRRPSSERVSLSNLQSAARS